MIKRKMAFSLLLLVFSTAAAAFTSTDTLKLTLNEACEYALGHNKELLNAKANILLANAEYRQTRARGLPHLNGTVDYMTNFNYEVEFRFSGTEDSDMPDINTDVLDEGDFEILSLLNEMFAPSDPATIVMKDQANARLQVSQLVFSGQFWIGLEIAELYSELSKKQVKKTEKDVKEQVAQTYYLILATEESLNIINKNLDNLYTTLTHTRNMYNAGVLEKYDVDQLRMNVSQLKNSREATKRNLQLTYNMLKIQLGLEPAVEIFLKESLFGLMEESENKLFAEKLNPKDNLTYQLINIQQLMDETQVKLNKWAYAPSLTGYYSYTEKLLTTDFDLSPKNAAGLTLSIPIFSGGEKKAQIDKAKVTLDKTQRNKTLLVDQLNLQENQLKYNLQSALDNYSTQQENVEIAKNVYQSIFNKYKQGLVSSLDLTQANNNFLQAENNYVSAILNVLQSILALESLYNTL
jgi:outer membrane protein TolC